MNVQIRIDYRMFDIEDVAADAYFVQWAKGVDQSSGAF
jgi:hypothetical protein